MTDKESKYKESKSLKKVEKALIVALGIFCFIMSICLIVCMDNFNTKPSYTPYPYSLSSDSYILIKSEDLFTSRRGLESIDCVDYKLEDISSSRISDLNDNLSSSSKTSEIIAWSALSLITHLSLIIYRTISVTCAKCSKRINKCVNNKIYKRVLKGFCYFYISYAIQTVLILRFTSVFMYWGDICASVGIEMFDSVGEDVAIVIVLMLVFAAVFAFIMCVEFRMKGKCRKICRFVAMALVGISLFYFVAVWILIAVLVLGTRSYASLPGETYTVFWMLAFVLEILLVVQNVIKRKRKGTSEYLILFKTKS